MGHDICCELFSPASWVASFRRYSLAPNRGARAAPVGAGLGGGVPRLQLEIPPLSESRPDPLGGVFVVRKLHPRVVPEQFAQLPVQRQGGALDQERLEDINSYIDHLEVDDPKVSGPSDVWKKLDALAQSMTDLNRSLVSKGR